MICKTEVLKGIRLSHTAQQKRGRTFEAQALVIIIPSYGISWSMEEPFAISLPFLLPSLTPTPKLREVCREVPSPPLHPMEPQKLQQQLGLKPLSAPQVTSCLPAGLIPYYPALSNLLAREGQVSRAEGCKRRLSKRHRLLLAALNGLTYTWCQK